MNNGDPDLEAKFDALALEPEAIALRQALDKALQAYWEFFHTRGCMPGIQVSVGEYKTPYRKLN